KNEVELINRSAAVGCSILDGESKNMAWKIWRDTYNRYSDYEIVLSKNEKTVFLSMLWAISTNMKAPDGLKEFISRLTEVVRGW
ncbi:MAG: hypothetical protein ABFC34_05335, partial [Methanobacterium sp.]